MKKILLTRLLIAILIIIVVSFATGYVLRVNQLKREFHSEANLEITQISEKIEENNQTIEIMEADLKQDYIRKADIIAHLLAENPTLLNDIDRLELYMELLDIDEVHFFNSEGIIFAGTVTEYFGFSFDSGEQMRFFAPMLEDHNLKLAQDVTPNTAEGTLMQYAMVWTEDKEILVQVGHQPQHLIEALEETELSYILPLIVKENDFQYIVVDNNTQMIVANTNDSLVGQEATLIDTDTLSSGVVETEGELFQYYSEDIGELTIIISISEKELYNDMFDSIFYNMMMVMVVAALTILFIIFFMTRTFIRPIYSLIDSLKLIAGGKLDTKVNVGNTPEFEDLGYSINHVVSELTSNNKRITEIFNNISVPIAIFTWHQRQGVVQPLGTLREILGLSPSKYKELISSGEEFYRLINSILKNPIEGETDLYSIDTPDGTKHLKIKTYNDNNKFWGIIIDLTREVDKQEQFRTQRDIDYLTQLLSRWGFREKMNKLFCEPEGIGVTAVFALDLDNLKYINDNYGHEYGDKMLSIAADALKNCSSPNTIAARIGGDEFILVIHSAEDRQEIEKNVDELRRNIAESYISLPDGKTLPLSFSGGYVFNDREHKDYDAMISVADATMYQVKKSGKGRIERYIKS